MKQHVSFVLLAEFDIDQGALLSRQFPTPLGADEQLLAGLMLPDGAEKQPEDWTIFFLNQTPLNTIAPVVSDTLEKDPFDNGDDMDLLYVLSLVRTKHDASVRRGGIVKAMAICTHLPYIQIFKPVLLIALDDYFRDPSMDCLERLFDSINAMDLSLMPTMSRDEKRIMRVSDRKDVFIEKFAALRESLAARYNAMHPNQQQGDDSDSEAHFSNRSRPRTISSTSSSSSISQPNNRPKRQDSPALYDKVDGRLNDIKRGGASEKSKRSTVGTSSDESARNIPSIKDTHYFETAITYRSLTLPIRVPLFTFDEEVGEYSMIQLIQTFSTPGASVQGPLHPHLHTNGALTNPIILLFNAIVTEKRVLFLSHGKPAGVVANYVLAACALASGCGSILRGITSRVFPYANLSSKEVMESVPGFVAGVTNPIFVTGRYWDLICNIDSGKMTVNKDIPLPSSPLNFPSPPTTTARPVPLRAESSIGSEEDGGSRTPSQSGHPNGNTRSDFTAKPDNADNAFMEEIMSVIALHYGENVIRARFIDYTSRFVRLASRYEEESTGQTTIGFSSRPFVDGTPGEFGRLGSGLNFWDENGGMRELQLNANRIEGWRRTNGYREYRQDFKSRSLKRSIQGFDLVHQIWRLRHAKHMSDREMELVMRTIMEQVQTYEQVVEFLAHFPTHTGGLVPLAVALFHHHEVIRDIVVEILNVLRAYPIGYQFLQSMNPFQRFAYVRMAYIREEYAIKGASGLLPPSVISRTPSNRSDVRPD